MYRRAGKCGCTREREIIRGTIVMFAARTGIFNTGN